MKKGDDVTDDEDTDMDRTSVSQDRVTVTLCTEELLLRTQYICLAFSACLKGKNMGGVKDMDGQYNTFSSSSWAAHLPAGPSCNIQGF